MLKLLDTYVTLTFLLSIPIIESNHYARFKLLVVGCWLLLAENRPQINTDNYF